MGKHADNPDQFNEVDQTGGLYYLPIPKTIPINGGPWTDIPDAFPPVTMDIYFNIFDSVL